VDAQVLPGNRVLITEQGGERVTERDFQGKVLWKHEVDGSPVAAQRLANGNTFIVTRDQLLEVDPAGKVTFTHSRPRRDLRAGRKLPGGEVVLITAAGDCLRLDAAGKELKSFPVGNVNTGALDVSADGRVLVVRRTPDRVAEYDGEGRVVWEARVPGAGSATRLPDGRALVACPSGRRVVEIDRAGRVVWEYKGTLPPHRARRR
jgi:outer membrane protein assembly factor BamB